MDGQFNVSGLDGPSRALTSKSRVGISASCNREDFGGTIGKFDDTRFGAFWRWTLGRQMSLDLSADYTRRNGDSPHRLQRAAGTGSPALRPVAPELTFLAAESEKNYGEVNSVAPNQG
jgi:hypothetical protein